MSKKHYLLNVLKFNTYSQSQQLFKNREPCNTGSRPVPKHLILMCNGKECSAGSYLGTKTSADSAGFCLIYLPSRAGIICEEKTTLVTNLVSHFNAGYWVRITVCHRLLRIHITPFLRGRQKQKSLWLPIN